MSNDGRRRGAVGNNDESDGEEEEGSSSDKNLLWEFASVRGVVEKLFDFMNRFVFRRDRATLSIVERYEGLEEMVKVMMLQSENYLVRAEAGRRIREMLVDLECYFAMLGARDGPNKKNMLLINSEFAYLGQGS